MNDVVFNDPSCCRFCGQPFNTFDLKVAVERVDKHMVPDSRFGQFGFVCPTCFMDAHNDTVSEGVRYRLLPDEQQDHEALRELVLLRLGVEP